MTRCRRSQGADAFIIIPAIYPSSSLNNGTPQQQQGQEKPQQQDSDATPRNTLTTSNDGWLMHATSIFITLVVSLEILVQVTAGVMPSHICCSELPPRSLKREPPVSQLTSHHVDAKIIQREVLGVRRGHTHICHSGPRYNNPRAHHPWGSLSF